MESVSYHMKKTNPGMKRNVRFDDETMDLVLDVKLGENHSWRRIRPTEARLARTALPSASSSGAAEEMGSDEVKTLLARPRGRTPPPWEAAPQAAKLSNQRTETFLILLTTTLHVQKTHMTRILLKTILT